jgi:hypothetical protein
LHAAKSARVRSITPSAIDRNVLDLTLCARAQLGLQVPCGAALNDDTRISTDMAYAQSCLLGSNASALDHRTCALDRTARETLISFCAYFPPFNRILMSMTCNTLRHQKLTKTLENNTAKSLINIS